MHLSNTSSIAQYFKNHSRPPNGFGKNLTDNTTILEQQNSKQKL